MRQASSDPSLGRAQELGRSAAGTCAGLRCVERLSGSAQAVGRAATVTPLQLCSAPPACGFHEAREMRDPMSGRGFWPVPGASLDRVPRGGGMAASSAGTRLTGPASALMHCEGWLGRPSLRRRPNLDRRPIWLVRREHREGMSGRLTSVRMDRLSARYFGQAPIREAADRTRRRRADCPSSHRDGRSNVRSECRGIAQSPPVSASPKVSQGAGGSDGTGCRVGA